MSGERDADNARRYHRAYSQIRRLDAHERALLLYGVEQQRNAGCTCAACLRLITLAIHRRRRFGGELHLSNSSIATTTPAPAPASERTPAIDVTRGLHTTDHHGGVSNG